MYVQVKDTFLDVKKWKWKNKMEIGPKTETKTEEVVETKTPKKEATKAKKTPAQTPKCTVKGDKEASDHYQLLAKKILANTAMQSSTNLETIEFVEMAKKEIVIKAGPVKPEKVEKEEPVIEAKEAGPFKPEKVEKEEPTKEVNDKENETTAEENTVLTKSHKKKKKKKDGKGEDSPVKPLAETKTEEVVETKNPKKEATEAKKTPAKTPKCTLKGAQWYFGMK